MTNVCQASESPLLAGPSEGVLPIVTGYVCFPLQMLRASRMTGYI